MPTHPRPAIFLDRDDTLVVNSDLPDAAWAGATPGDLLDPAHVRPIAGVHEALQRLRTAGYALVVITNQGGVARAHGSLTDVDATNDALRARLAEDDPRPALFRDTLIDACYACPFHPSGIDTRFADEHAWRKPNPGMILAAADELRLDLASSWLVGDAQRDVDAGVAAGIDPARCLRVGPETELVDLAAATDVILAPASKPRAVRASSVTLRVDPELASERPFASERVRESVLASARAIAERTGVNLLDLSTTDAALTAVLEADRMAALGFASELRRATDAWHRARFGRALWLDRSDA